MSHSSSFIVPGRGLAPALEQLFPHMHRPACLVSFAIGIKFEMIHVYCFLLSQPVKAIMQ